MPAVDRINAPDPRTIKVDFGGEVVTITYNRNAATPDLLARMEEAAGTSPAAQQVASCDSLAEVLISWDVTETSEEGSPMLEPTVANLRTLPLAFLSAIFSEIQEDNRPPSKSSSSFASG